MEIITYAQNYLATIMSINILLASATGFLVWNSPSRIFKFLFLSSLILYGIAITAILFSYESFFEYLLIDSTVKNTNIKEPFKILDYVFCLDLSGLIITIITFIFLPIKYKRGQNEI